MTQLGLPSQDPHGLAIKDPVEIGLFTRSIYLSLSLSATNSCSLNIPGGSGDTELGLCPPSSCSSKYLAFLANMKSKNCHVPGFCAQGNSANQVPRDTGLPRATHRRAECPGLRTRDPSGLPRGQHQRKGARGAVFSWAFPEAWYDVKPPFFQASEPLTNRLLSTPHMYTHMQAHMHTYMHTCAWTHAHTHHSSLFSPVMLACLKQFTTRQFPNEKLQNNVISQCATMSELQ